MSTKPAQTLAICCVALTCIVLLWSSSGTRIEVPSIGGKSRRYMLKEQPSLHDKLEHAERLWRQSATDRQQMLKDLPKDAKFPDGYIFPYHVWDFSRPSFFCPHDLERVGKLGDGGKVVCGMSRYEEVSPGPSSTKQADSHIIYSFGIKDDSSFEAALLERTNAEIWGYDFSVGSWAGDIMGLPREQRLRAHFHQAGLARATSRHADPPFFSIQDLMTDNGHDYIDITKMDIEGGEFDVLTSFIDNLFSTTKRGEVVLPVGQLLIEIHLHPYAGSFVPTSMVEWMNWFQSLEEAGLRPVNDEPNWVGDNGYGKPRFMEFTLINAKDQARNKLLWS